MSSQGKLPEELFDAAPPRLLDDPTSSALVRHDLSNTASAAPSYDAAAGLLVLQAALGTTAKLAATGSAGSSATASTLSSAAKGALAIKLAIGGGLTAIAIGGAAMLTTPPAHDLARSAPRAPAVQQVPAHAPAFHETPTVVEAQPQPQPQPQAQSQPQPHVRAEAAVSHGPRDRAADEIAQLAQIKALVKGAPARALRLAEQGHRQFGEGYLHHEREGLAIIALHALGRRDEAQARAQRYLVRYPHSPLSERVRALESDVSAP